MSRTRLVSMYLAAALAASLVLATAATADVIRPTFSFSGSGFITSEEVGVKLHSLSAHFYYEGISGPIIECTTALGKGEILNSGGVARINKLEMTFEECSVPGHTSTCSINGSLKHGSLKTTSIIESELGYQPPAVPSEVLVNMASSSGTFLTVEFSGTSCPLSPGTYQIKKGIISEIPGSEINTPSPIKSFLAVIGVNASQEQVHKEIELVSLTSTIDELKIGTTPVSLGAELQFTALNNEFTIVAF
jgi:hypothetical protein